MTVGLPGITSGPARRPAPNEPTENARSAAAFARVVGRQRRSALRLAGVITMLMPATSVVVHLVLRAPFSATMLAAVTLLVMSAIAIATARIRYTRLWLPAAILGMTGVTLPVAVMILEPIRVSIYALGVVGMTPIGVAVFGTWGARQQLAWSVIAGATLVGLVLFAPFPTAELDLRPAIVASFLIGVGFGAIAARLFDVARHEIYCAAVTVHARRHELVAAHHRAARTLGQLRAVEAIGAQLTEFGATPLALDGVVASLHDHFGYSHPSIYLGDDRLVRLGAHRGYTTVVPEIAAGDHIIGRALETGALQLLPNVRLDPDYRSASPDVVSEIVVPLRADGRIIGVLNVESTRALDTADLASITVVADRVAAALDLAERHRRLESIVDGAPVAIVAYDADTEVRFWGAGAQRIFGWTSDEVRGKRGPLIESIGEGDEAYQAIMAGEPVSGIETERRARDGRLVPVRIFAAPFEDGPGRGQVVVYQDLTVERETATALAASEARYETLVSTLHEGVMLLSADGRIVASNPAAGRILGLTVDELAALTASDPLWQAIREDGSEFPADEHAAATALRIGQPVLGVTMGLHKPTGELIWVHVDAVPLPAGAEPAGGVVVSFSDVTERQRLQADLLQAQKMESVGRLAGGIAHDFNNLLTAILGNSQMLAELVEDDAAGHVGEIQGAAERAAELTRQLLGFARKTMLNPGDHPLNLIVADMEPMIRRLVGSHIEVVVALDPAVGHVRVDRSQMDQVLLNLAVNARDAMADGGVLSIETAAISRRELDPSVAVDADRIAMLSVRDSGIGMTGEVLRHAFDPFYTTKPRGRGTGLGLATTHGIVMQSGGTITVDSAPGDGSTFRIYLPEVVPAALPTATQQADARVGGGETILLVEDEDAVRDVARRILERAGYRVVHAPNGAAAISAIDAGSMLIDLVVSDVVMPGMRGPEMYRVLRDAQPGLPAVFLSGYADLADATHALPPGSRFLAKPYLPDDLIRVVQLALEERAA